MWFEQVKEHIAKTQGTVGFLVKNLATGERHAVNEEVVFSSASTIKVPILLALLDACAAGRLSLDAAEVVDPAEIVGGCGLIQCLSGSLAYTLRDLAVLMITVSDNTATNRLISAVGMEAVNAKLEVIGASETVLGRKMMDVEARLAGRDNFTSCRDMEHIFTYIHKNSGRYSEAISILKQQQLNDMLPLYTDRDTYEFAHKTGDLDGIRHNVGIMYLKDPILVAFLSKDLTHNRDGMALSNQLGAIVYNQYC